MAVTISQRASMEMLIEKLITDFPSYQFVPGSYLHWSPRKQSIFYPKEGSLTDVWGIFHELGHAELGHMNYQTDTALLRMEVAAWSKAQRIARHYSIIIEETHIENCLDTYRDWLYKRSACPSCNSNGCQVTHTKYICTNCSHVWTVSQTRFCRPYRRAAFTK